MTYLNASYDTAYTLCTAGGCNHHGTMSILASVYCNYITLPNSGQLFEVWVFASYTM